MKCELGRLKGEGERRGRRLKARGEQRKRKVFRDA